MAEYLSQAQGDLIVFGSSYSGLTPTTLAVNPDVQFMQQDHAASRYGNLQPINMLQREFGSIERDGPQRNFLYDKIYVDPAYVNLASLTVETTVPIKVWNAFLHGSQVQTLTSVGSTEGVTVSPPSSLPIDMPPLEEQSYDFIFAVDGPSNIDLVFNLTVDGDANYITFVGFRSRAWGFPHNWADDVQEVLSWLTDFKKTRTGGSQRAALKAIPNVRVSYSFMLTNEERQKLETLLYRWKARPWQVPFLQRGTVLTAEAAASSQTLTCDTTKRGFAVGQTVLIVSSDGTANESAEIETLSDTEIGTARELGSTWPVGSIVYPAAAGYIDGDVSFKKRKINTVTGQVTFKCAPVSTDPWVPNDAAPVTYNDREVLLTQPDWKDGIDGTNTMENDYIDNGLGVSSYFPSHEQSSAGTRYGFLLTSRTEIEDFRAFLGRVKGRAKAFYCPTWDQDLYLYSTVNGGDTVINVTDPFFSSLVDVDPARGHLYIEARDGNYYCRPILDVTPEAGYATISIGTALGASYDPSEIKRISYMPLWTLATDMPTLLWKRVNIVVADLYFQEVPA